MLDLEKNDLSMNLIVTVEDCDRCFERNCVHPNHQVYELWRD